MASDEPIDDDIVTVTEAPPLVLPEDGPLDPDTADAVATERSTRRWPHRRRRSRRRHLDIVIAVGVGGSIGALGRYALGTAFPVRPGRFPWTTLAINLSGSLALGVVLYIVFERRLPSRLLRPFLAIGVIGSFTTFSTFAVEVVQRADGHPQVAAIYLLASVSGGPLAVLAGSASVRWIYARPRRRQLERGNP